MELELVNKVVVVTGATGGIGKYICQAFLKEGAIVIPLYRHKDKLDQLYEWLADDIEDESSFAPQQVDIEDTTSIKKVVFSVIKEFKKIDVLVNNVGVVHEIPFLLLDEELWDEEVKINLSSVARVTRLVLRYMILAKDGAVINISSISGKRFGRGAVAYATTKAAIDRFTEALSMEVGLKGIRINAVCPGVIDIGMGKALTARWPELIRGFTALQRVGQPEEVVPAVLFLASKKTASFISGHKLRVDGGLGL